MSTPELPALSVDQTYLSCQQRLQVIEKALQSTSSTFGFTVTMKFAQELLVQLIAQKKTLSPSAQKSLFAFSGCLDRYDKYLKTQENRSWKKLLNSNKLRKLDLLDTALYNATVDLTRETNSTLLVTLLKEDEDAQKMWETEFGLKQLIVPWDQFVERLDKHLELSEEVRHKLRWILDKGHTGYVTLFRFSELLKSFGPFKSCITKVSEILDLPFFYGYLTSTEAEIILRRSVAGSYLIRFSISRSRSFALSFLDTNHIVKHCIIECLPQGFIINELINSNSRDRVFPNLSDLCNCYTKALKTPLNCPLVKESYFHGDLSTEDTNELLQGQPEGSYLFRLCNQENQIVLSYMSETGVRTNMVSWTPEGFAFQGHNHVFATLSALVYSRQELKLPIGNPRNYRGFVLAESSPLRMPTMDDLESKGGGGSGYSNIYDAIPNIERELRLSEGKSISGPGGEPGSVPDTPFFSPFGDSLPNPHMSLPNSTAFALNHHSHNHSNHSFIHDSSPSPKSNNNYIMMPKVPKKKAAKSSIFSFNSSSASSSTNSISISISNSAAETSFSTSYGTPPTLSVHPVLLNHQLSSSAGNISGSASSPLIPSVVNCTPPSPPTPASAQNGTKGKLPPDLSRSGFIAGSTGELMAGPPRESSQRSSLGIARTSGSIPGTQVSPGTPPSSPALSSKSPRTSHLDPITPSGSSPNLQSRPQVSSGSALINRSHSCQSADHLLITNTSEKSLLKEAQMAEYGPESEGEGAVGGMGGMGGVGLLKSQSEKATAVGSIPKSRSNVALNNARVNRPYSGKSLFIKRQISQQTTLPLSFYRTKSTSRT